MSSQTITISTTTPDGLGVIPPSEGFLAHLNQFLKDFAPEGFMPNLTDVVLGLGTIVSLAYAIKIPWNNYFKARETRIQLEKNDAEGVAVLERDRQETLKIEKWLLVLAVSLHFVGGLFVYGISRFTEGRLIKPQASLIFVGSIVIRPVLAAHSYIKGRLDQIMKRTVHPESEITLLRREIDEYKQVAHANAEEIRKYHEATFPRLNKGLGDRFVNFAQDYAKNRDQDLALAGADRELATRHNEANRVELEKLKKEITLLVAESHQLTKTQFDAIALKFEETARTLSPDKQMLFGIQQFLGLVRKNLFPSETK